MAKKKQAPAPENHERWLVSYADFITLLFAFFVVMFASSQTDKSRAKQVSQAVEKALADGHSISVPPAVARILGGTVDEKGQGNAMMRGPGGAQHAMKEPPEDISELLPALDRLNKELEEEIKAGKLELHLEARGLVISLRESAFFPSGTDVLDRASSQSTIDTLAKLIASVPNQIQLEGHTDSIPIHNARFKSNWELSCARGIAVLEALVASSNLSRDRFSVVGRADTLPVATNDTAEGRARNRRVDVVIVNSLRVGNTQAVKAVVRK